jgi:hypothetical protein
MAVTGQRTSYMNLVDEVAEKVGSLGGNTDEGDAVTRAHLWDVPVLPDPDTALTPGMYYDTSHNLGGVGNAVVEVFTIPGVIMQRATGIDSGKIATRRQYGGQWSAWASA